jgi:hypothetical protein
MAQPLRIYISSTFSDLELYREAVYKALRKFRHAVANEKPCLIFLLSYNAPRPPILSDGRTIVAGDSSGRMHFLRLENL